jgi:hypothetical protein
MYEISIIYQTMLWNGGIIAPPRYRDKEADPCWLFTGRQPGKYRAT